ncbi:homoserine O-acetyltransferase [Williamsia sp. CHRR-6]|uniref:homoserine O-acetyltransferase MetX n=1 Tax=Williamsia sp. CHRR-6 TaxID=2835871 RepID=UPI001BDA9D2D|nr:homoserine O-acetyltransferase [Williamsia sp. CHRR-6]MBT0566791.1 homoserine O-acetyltransferase [Williamsia sp. CHRR-6]
MTVSIDPRTHTATDWENLPDGALTSVSVGPLATEGGGQFEDVTLAFQRWGHLAPTRDNVVIALHALTGDSHVTGAAGPDQPSPGWWDGLIGPGCAVDTDEWCVIAANVLGGCRGSTGPATLDPTGRPWGSRFPIITVRDQVRAEVALMDTLGIDSVAAVLGGSMGGARSLEWIVGHPDRVRSALVLAVGPRATADQIGTQTTQVAAITSDPHWQGGDYHGTGSAPTAGLGIARRIAHMTYRSELEMDNRFGNSPQGQEIPLQGGRYSVQSYLEHQANKLIERFDPGSYVVLSEVLNHHDVGRDRGGVAAALAGCTVPTIVGGISSDRLYPLRTQAEIADLLTGCVGGLHVVESDNGHDGFLTEFDAIAELLALTMDLARH